MFETASAMGKDVRSRKVAHSGIPTPRAGWNVGRRERRGTASTAMILAPTRPPHDLNNDGVAIARLLREQP